MKNRFSCHRNLLIGLIFGLFLACLRNTHVFSQENYIRLDPGEQVVINGEIVTNAQYSAYSYFVPMNTPKERNAFLAAANAGSLPWINGAPPPWEPGPEELHDSDRDGDGLPDYWEVFYGLNSDADGDDWADTDGDGWTNIVELAKGSNPGKPDSDEGETIVPIPEISGTIAGYTPGSFGVAETGAASYTIPLVVPPGTAGLVPQITLNYDSRAGNSLLGMGWSLSGISVIGRCSTTIAQDGFVDGVDFDETDKLCIDGQRLVVVNGNYGKHGTEYRVENEVFSRIRQTGDISSNTSSFTVETKSGLIYEYGKTSQSQIRAEGIPAVYSWSVNKVSDRKGNYYTVSYSQDEDSGEAFPTRIDYTGNKTMGLVPYNSVRFEYESRPDPIRNYLGGSLVSVKKRLKKIQMYNQQTKVREYTLQYEQSPSTNRSRITRVTECGASSEGKWQCLSPTTFLWKDSGSLKFRIHDGYPDTEYDVSANNYRYFTADFTGDGKTDLLHFADADTANVWTSTGKDGRFAISTLSIGEYNLALGTYNYHTGDFNGDGISDLIHFAAHDQVNTWLSKGDGTFQIKVSVPDAGLYDFSAGNYQYLTGDFNGDNKTDIIHFVNEDTANIWLAKGDGTFRIAAYNNFSHNLKEDSHNLQTGDFNGDGRSDVIQLVNRPKTDGRKVYVYIWISNGDGSFTIQSAFPTDGYAVEDDNDKFVSGDFNGDGRVDFIYFVNNNDANVWFSRGDGTFDIEANFPPEESDYWLKNGGYKYKSGDFNGDGMDDLVHFSEADIDEINVWISKGDGTFQIQKAPYSEITPDPDYDISANEFNYHLGDFNGDGSLDMVHFVNDRFVRVWEADWGTSDSMEHIVNGHGAQTKIEYLPLTDNTIYSKGNDAVFPQRDIQSSMYIVSAYETGNGIGGISRVSYTYTGLKYLMDGRGFAGFRTITIKNHTSGIITKTYYHQHHPFKSLPKKTVTYLSSENKPLSRLENDWDAIQFGLSRYFPFVRQTTREQYELDGTLVSRSTITTEKQDYDSFGNARKVVLSYHDGLKRITTNTWSNNTEKWFIGQLVRSSVASEAPELPAITRTSAFEYFSSDGLLKKEVIEPDDTAENLKLVMDYTYDEYGNVTRVTTTGSVDASNTQQSKHQISRYDDKKRFATEVENALGYVEKREYDNKSGNVILYTDVDQVNYGNNAPSIMSKYDAFGRVTGKTFKDGTEERSFYLRCNGSNSCPDGAIYFIQTQSSGNASIRNYYDLLDRVIRIENIGFDGRKIYTDTIYNARGGVEKISEPYFAGETPLWTRYQYDAIGRRIKTIYPDNSEERMSYHGLTTVLINALNQKFTKTVNSTGDTIKTVDNENTQTDFFYDASGNLVQTTMEGVSTTIRYDLRGRKMYIDDPDTGAIQYKHNAFGELIEQIDTKNQTVTNSYDVLGRLIRRTEPEGTTIWEYVGLGEARFGIGNLKRVAGPNGFVRRYHYDHFSRLVRISTTVSDLTFSTSTVYDVYSRAKYSVYPTGFAIENHYNIYGFLYKVGNANRYENTIYWEMLSQNARGQITQQKSGNGLITKKIYDSKTKFLKEIHTGPSSSSSIQNLRYTFDALGNLKSRHDDIHGLNESFLSDGLNRMIEGYVYGMPQKMTQYDKRGNITFRSGVGTYIYGENGAGPHAVTTIHGGPAENTYTYDANGNRRTSNTGSITYSSYNKPVQIIAGNNQFKYSYCPDRNKYRKQTTIGGYLTRTYYVGGMYEKELNGNEIKYKHYIPGEGISALYLITGDYQYNLLSKQTRYLHKDHLNSLDTITDEVGNVTERFSFDAWGKRRNATTWGDDTSLMVSTEVNRGFTGHEQLDDVNLVHMGGRVYDPVIGRFISPDPFIQSPDNTQAFNRYSYVLNNPVSYIDPSGFFSLKKFLFGGIGFLIPDKYQDQAITIALSVSAAWLSGGTLAPMMGIEGVSAGILGGTVGGFAGGVTGTALAGGDFSESLTAGFKGAVVSATIAGLDYQVASLFGGEEFFDLASKRAFEKSSIGQGFVSSRQLNWAALKYVSQRATSGFVSGSLSHAASEGGSLRNILKAGFRGSALSAGIATLNVSAHTMRVSMMRQSIRGGQPVEATSISKEALWDFKLGGVRPHYEIVDGIMKLVYGKGPMGGGQYFEDSDGLFKTGEGQFLWWTYEKGDWEWHLVETFAGPHDWLNGDLWRGYDPATGYYRHLPGTLPYYFGEIMNVVDVPIAAPFAAARGIDPVMSHILGTLNYSN